MKQIEIKPGFWHNGKFNDAHFLLLRLGNDNLETSCQFYYEFFSEDKTKIGIGNLTMDGETYKNWDGTNAAAWDFVCTALNVILAETK